MYIVLLLRHDAGHAIPYQIQIGGLIIPISPQIPIM
jgi:hypothetical protein